MSSGLVPPVPGIAKGSGVGSVPFPPFRGEADIRWREAAAAHPEALLLEIAKLRRDGGTQHRDGIRPRLVATYAELMAQGAALPPVRVWFDGVNYWLTDGFHRVAAAERIGRQHISAEVRSGSLGEARWDSFQANSAHGARRSPAETRKVIQAALQHPNAARLSNIEIARHLNIAEATLRRWRRILSPASCQDDTRLVTRGNSTYLLKISRIGKKRRERAKSIADIRIGMEEMKCHASPDVRRLLNIFDNWALGRANTVSCLNAIETAVGEWTSSAR